MEGNSKFEEDKTQLFPQELVMKIQSERQDRPLREQKLLIEEARRQETHLLNKLIFADNFGKDVSEYPN